MNEILKEVLKAIIPPILIRVARIIKGVPKKPKKGGKEDG